jgi:large subunit ribosomal protein L35
MTGSGKLLRTKLGKSHLRRKKAARTKRLFDEMVATSTADKKRIRRLLPYK